ncbi:hypothetical protein QJQ45_003370 [Haematococcus lacustris]|nr:hypothetical protein QJQ45_003370 [Haematococcus lacustris]
MQRIRESRWRPLELSYWPEQGKLQAKGKEYPELGYKQDTKTLAITIADIKPDGSAAKAPERMCVGDQLIATSGVTYDREADYGVMVKMGQKVVRLMVQGETFKTVSAAIGSHPGHIPVTLEFQRCEPAKQFGPKAWKYELREHIYHYHATEMQLLDRLSYALEQDACDIFNRLPLSEQRFLLPLEDLEDSEEQHLTHQQQQPRAAATSPLLDATKPEHGAAGSVAPPIPTLSALPQSAAPQPNTSDKQPDTQPDKQPDKQPVKQPDNQPDNLSTQQPDTQPDTQPDKQPDTQHDMQSTKQPELQPLAVLACPFACGKDVLVSAKCYFSPEGLL